VAPVAATLPVVRVRHLRRQRQPRRPPPAPVARTQEPTGTGEAHQLIERCNDALQAAGIAIHLRLAETDDGLELEIHDCTDGHICKVLHDRRLDLAELPLLLTALARQAGLIVDIVV